MVAIVLILLVGMLYQQLHDDHRHGTDVQVTLDLQQQEEGQMRREV